MTPQRVTLITLGVADLAKAKAFYAALGWQESRPQEGVAFYQMQGAVLALFGRADLAADQGRPGAAGRGAAKLCPASRAASGGARGASLCARCGRALCR